MSYYRAHALTKLVAEIDAAFPKRQKGKGSSDGWVGDASHQARKSDHNPDYSRGGVVRAQDIDEDLLGADNPLGQEQMALVAEHLRNLGKGGDPRLVGGAANGYIIYEGHIAGAGKGWNWRVYTGPNAHKHHLHVSVCANPAGYDSIASWGIAALVAPVPAPPPLPPMEDDEDMVLYTPTDFNGNKHRADGVTPIGPVVLVQGNRRIVVDGDKYASYKAMGAREETADPHAIEAIARLAEDVPR